jgi:hypothetical protein
MEMPTWGPAYLVLVVTFHILIFAASYGSKYCNHFSFETTFGSHHF